MIDGCRAASPPPAWTKFRFSRINISPVDRLRISLALLAIGLLVAFSLQTPAPETTPLAPTLASMEITGAVSATPPPEPRVPERVLEPMAKPVPESDPAPLVDANRFPPVTAAELFALPRIAESPLELPAQASPPETADEQQPPTPEVANAPLPATLALPQQEIPHASFTTTTTTAAAAVPPLTREFRGAWIATVGNLDWPSKPGLSSTVQQAELIALFDQAVALRLNAIILQVRPSSDALYASKLEPWSHYLSGEMGKPPEPYYDPLEFAVVEAHKRGLELHAWFNPFRALTSAKHVRTISADHVSRRHPAHVRRYGDLLWLDPGETAVRDRVIEVIADVVRRYEIDGVHIDDYFYPYRAKDKKGKPIDFPDDASWKRYVTSGGALVRNDWRRENVNDFVRRLYARIKAEKSWVQFGISPFGIWRPQKAPLISGLDAYDELYADSRKWLENGWLDYVSPQLYWSSDAPKQNYAVLLQWWTGANRLQRHLWPGLAPDRIGPARPASDILSQIGLTRARSRLDTGGNIHWHFKALARNVGQISDRLTAELYSQPALVPASPWLGAATIPEKPDVSFAPARLSWKMKDAVAAKVWALQLKHRGAWTLEVLAGTQTVRDLDPNNPPEAVALTPIDRFGHAGPAAVLEPGRTLAAVPTAGVTAATSATAKAAVAGPQSSGAAAPEVAAPVSAVSVFPEEETEADL